MRKLILTAAAAITVLAAGSLTTQRAEAFTLPAPSGLAAVANELNLTEDVRLVCSRVWDARRGRMRTRCYETRPRIIIRRPYRGPRGPRIIIR